MKLFDEDESKKSARKSIKESKDITVEEFISDYKNNDCFSIRDRENGHESECFWGSKKDVLDSDYRLFTVLDTDVDKETDDIILYIDLEENAWVESKKFARKSIKESINYEVEGLYFFNFDVGEKCSIDLKDAFNADGVISEFYKNENRIYSIVVCSAIDYYFFISYDYRKKKVIHSECFSSYQNAKNEMRDWLENI